MHALILSALFLLTSVFTLTECQAQCPPWKKNRQTWQIRSGVGLLPTFAKDRASTLVPPMSLELRYRPSPTFSLGLLAGRSVSEASRTYLTGNEVTYQNDFRMLAIRAGAHTRRWTKWSAYGGIVLGYQNSIIHNQEINTENRDEGPSYQRRDPSHLLFSAFMGSAYHPLPQLEIFGELGFGLSILTMGVGYSW